MIKVAQLHIYPVKSMQGIDLASVQLNGAGFVNDRRWMVVDTGGTFITQREAPLLASIQTALTDDQLLLRLPNGESISIQPSLHSRQSCRVRVWNDTCTAFDEGDEAAQFLSSAIGRECRFVRMPDLPTRTASIPESHDTYSMHFGDSQPLHLISLASVHDCVTRSRVEFGPDRFRANIVLQGCSAFEEDGWRTLTIRNTTFSVLRTTSRCTITTIDQQTAESSDEPLRTLSLYRRWNNRTHFGIYLRHVQHTGNLEIGDEVIVHHLGE